MAAIALGDIHYRAKSYSAAINAYGEALRIVPDTYKISVNDKIRKSKRNIKRETARYASWAVLGLWLIAVIAGRSLPKSGDLWASALVLACYGFIGGLYFAFTYEKSLALLLPASTMAVCMSLVLLWNRTLGRGYKKSGPIVIAHAVTASPAVLYLTLYGFHYLYVFGL